MSKNKEERLWTFRFDHMIEACVEIIEFTKDIDEETFYENKKAYRAVERCFQILGEAAKHIPPEKTKEIPDIPWREIQGMRNIVVHEYDNIADDVLWTTSRNDIPALLEKLKAVKSRMEKE